MTTIRKQGNNWQVVFEIDREKFVRSVGQDDLTAKIKQLEMKRLAENFKAGKIIVPSGMERKELGEWAWRQIMPQKQEQSTVGDMIDGYGESGPPVLWAIAGLVDLLVFQTDWSQ